MPHRIRAIRHLDRLVLSPGVTIFVGENVSGKSTPVEAIAVKWGGKFPGRRQKKFRFATPDSHSDLQSRLVLEKPSDEADRKARWRSWAAVLGGVIAAGLGFT